MTRTVFHGLDGAHAGKYGGVNTALLGQPDGARVHGELLPARRPPPITIVRRPLRLAGTVVDWQRALQRNGPVAHRRGEVESGRSTCLRLHVYLDELDPNMVQVELYADELTAIGRFGRR